jgi:hypothetical protein
MASELKVYNRFDELTLHVRLSLDNVPELQTIDGTPEMRAAIASLRGTDFDRMVLKGKELQRLTANWGSPGYLNVLARYFVMNFGWRTTIVETEKPSTAVLLTASGNSAPPVYYGVSPERPAAYTMLMRVNINKDSPDFQPTATDLLIASKKAPKAASANVFSIA